MQDESTPSRPLSGFQRRKLREAQGLSRYTDGERAGRRRYDKGRDRDGYFRYQAITDAIKLQRGCTDCGYRVHPAALHFDHLPGTNKVANIAWLRAHGSLASIMAEIAKCEVVCANCHAVRTAARRLR